MTALQKVEVQEAAESNTVSMFERLARDPSVDVEKLERLMAMKERADAMHAQTAFNAAFADMQGVIPTISEKGEIRHNGKLISTYAKFEDLMRVLKPILQAHGFAITFKMAHGEKATTYTGILMHRLGHREETSFVTPPDTSGAKSGVQAQGSAQSYAQRYIVKALLNIATGGEDDDGAEANGPDDSLRLPTIEKLKEASSVEDMRARYKALSPAERKSIKQADIDAIKGALS